MHIFDYYIKLYEENQEIHNNTKENITSLENEKNEEKEEETDSVQEKSIEKNERIDTGWIKKIFIKLLFIYHPDKNIKSNEEIFSKLNNDYDNNNYFSLFYYFLLEKENSYIISFFNEISKTQKFQSSLESLTNALFIKVNSTKSKISFEKKID